MHFDKLRSLTLSQVRKRPLSELFSLQREELRALLKQYGGQAGLTRQAWLTSFLRFLRPSWLRLTTSKRKVRAPRRTKQKYACLYKTKIFRFQPETYIRAAIFCWLILGHHLRPSWQYSIYKRAYQKMY